MDRWTDRQTDENNRAPPTFISGALIIMNLGQWVKKRCRLKDFLSGALAALLFGGAVPFMQF